MQTKKIISAVTLSLFVSLITIGCNQNQLPDFQILLSDSTTIFDTKDIPKGELSLFIHFDSECKGCQTETEELLQHIEELKHVKMYFVSIEDFANINLFCDYFNLSNYTNIIVGKDYERMIPRHFQTYATPLMALYDKHKKLRVVISGKAEIADLLGFVNKYQ